MASFSMFYCLTVGCLLLSLYPGEITSTHEKLMSSLLKHYNKRIAPGEVDAKHANLNVWMSLVSIIDLNIETRVLESTMWLFQEYTDPRMAWNATDHDNITSLRVSPSDVWVPDIQFHHLIDSPSLLSMMEYKLMVTHSGHMTYVPALKVKTRCQPTHRYDEFKCSWKLGSWAYHAEFVNLMNSKNTIDTSGNVAVDLVNWNITETKMWRKALKYPCCPEIYPAVYASVTLRRRV